ncbi:MAG TPA: hypothetical protein VM680_05215 [Verrucomicrobiae bacterium]|nr:hypothetical protein [Verrucomicrobiae bacterium]
MFTWPDLKFRSRACVAQLKLRVIVHSMIVLVPAWIALTVLQRLGFGGVADHSIRAVGLTLLILYLVGVVIIVRRTQRDNGLVCPKCDGLLGPELRQVSDKGECCRCGELIAKP